MKRLFIFLRKDTIFVDRPADSVVSPFATLLDYCLSYTASLAYFLVSCILSHILSYSRTLWLIFAALILYMPKNGATFQNRRLIVIYHLDESRSLASFRASTVSPAVVFVLDANTRSCASASLITFDIRRHR